MNDWHIGALIKDENGDIPKKKNCKKTKCPKCGGKGCPSWRYRTEPFQWAVTQSGMSYQEIERQCGWQKGYVTRVLGLRPTISGDLKGSRPRYRTCATTMSYDNAVKLAKALGLDFTEWEL